MKDLVIFELVYSIYISIYFDQDSVKEEITMASNGGSSDEIPRSHTSRKMKRTNKTREKKGREPEDEGSSSSTSRSSSSSTPRRIRSKQQQQQKKSSKGKKTRGDNLGRTEQMTAMPTTPSSSSMDGAHETSLSKGGQSQEMNGQKKKNKKTKAQTVNHPTMEEVMDELQTRFLVNLPESELSSSERIFFQIEQCYWFYEDFYADQFKHLVHYKLTNFAQKMFEHCPLLQPLSSQCEHMLQDFKLYQSQVPVNGCILLNKEKTKILLVCNWKGTSWSLPRGKVNERESDLECAKREVKEECGYDVYDKDLASNYYLEYYQKEQRLRMYIVQNVSEDFNFQPTTRKEISSCQWFGFDELPKRTWCVLPFMSRLKRWVYRQNGQKKKQHRNTKRSSPRKGKNAGPSGPTMSQPIKILTNPNRVSQSSSEKSSDLSTCSQSSSSPSGVRGHFGTEHETVTSRDQVNDITFGTSSSSFSVEDMFKINEQLTGQKFVYDGNPNDFGSPQFCQPATTLSSLYTSNPSSRSVGVSQEMSTPMEEMQPGQVHGSDALTSFKFDTSDIMACVV